MVSPLTPSLSPLRGEGVAMHPALQWVSVEPRTVRLRHRAHTAAKPGDCSRHGLDIRRAPCPVTSHLGNSQVIGNQGRHPFVVQAGQKSSREVTGRNARTKSGGFSPLNGERAGVRGENTHCWPLPKKAGMRPFQRYKRSLWLRCNFVTL